MGCTKECCRDYSPDKKVVSLGLIDAVAQRKFLFEATPDIVSQVRSLNETKFATPGSPPDGIFLTHAHIGHYAGLQFLGRESMNTRSVPVYAMPRMDSFLRNNGPWSQLMRLNNISVFPLRNKIPVTLTSQITVTPLQVPHRDEYSETVGYLIKGPHKKILFIPDIDKWEKWEENILQLVREVDHALIDGTFFSNEEVGHRNEAEIPHPLVNESVKKFGHLPEEERNKIIFIHFNHTNPLMNPTSKETKEVLQSGFQFARIGMQFNL
jgi:pyrroloquinoline quinone biosynthesis protein B